MIQTKRTYMEEDKQQVHLPDINRTHKVSKFVIKRKNKVKLDPEIVKSKLRAIDLRKSAKATNIDCSKSTISVKESAISSEQSSTTACSVLEKRRSRCTPQRYYLKESDVAHLTSMYSQMKENLSSKVSLVKNFQKTGIVSHIKLQKIKIVPQIPLNLKSFQKLNSRCRSSCEFKRSQLTFE